MKKANLIIASIIALAAAPTFAMAECQKPDNSCGTENQAIPQIANNQGQYGNVYSKVQLLAGSSANATSAATGVGSAFSARVLLTGADVTSKQFLGANVDAKSLVNIDQARGLTISTAVAQGNAGQIEACCANIYASAEQIAEYGSNVSATSKVKVKSSDTIVSNAQAAANNFAIASKNGYVESWNGQYNAANVKAVSEVEACCNNGSITSNAVAAGNSNTIVGQGATIYSVVDQKNYGNVSAVSKIHNHSATNNLATATAMGNSATVLNEWGYTQLGGYQENSGAINAQAIVLNDHFNGSAVAAASAYGNTALLSNVGTDARIDMYQNNFQGAPVTANATLFGSSSTGGVGMASSFAAGNTMTGYTCAACGGGNVKMNGSATQYNYAPVTATTNINMGTSGSIVGSATAIGNSATFIAQRAGN